MAWAAARTWVTGEVVTGAEMNGTRDNLTYFKGEDDWHYPALLNGWAIYVTPYFGPRYKKVGRVVMITGLASGGTFSTAVPGTTGAIFTLPVGYRPPERMTFAVLSNNLYGRIDVENDTGYVVAYQGSATWMSLADIHFPVLT